MERHRFQYRRSRKSSMFDLRDLHEGCRAKMEMNRALHVQPSRESSWKSEARDWGCTIAADLGQMMEERSYLESMMKVKDASLFLRDGFLENLAK